MPVADVPPSPTPKTASGPATHEAWNAAIVDYFTRNLPPGSPVYLSVDERALLAIRRTRLGRPGSTLDGALNEFSWVLRNWCRTPPRGGGERVNFPPKPTHDSEGRPTCMVFLAAMVLAAYYMEEDEDHSGQAYFPQLRDVLGVVDGQGRPPGLGHADELLWQRWNRWLEACGWQSTARRGEGGSWKYIEYPLSQCLLRRTDHQRLARLFRDAEMLVDRSWDHDQFAAHLPLLAQRLGTTRLAGLLLDTSEPKRHQVIVDDAYEVFRSPWHEVEDFDTFTLAPSGPRSLEAGLYRLEKDRRGNVQYFLYPRVPRSWQDDGLNVEVDGHWYSLTPERPGWFAPLPEPMRPGKRLCLKVNGGSQELNQLILPDSPFWTFIQDPDGFTNDLATWGTPLPGEPFLLLAREELAQPLETLRQQEFLRWQGDPVPADFGRWNEYRDCQVCRFDWEAVPDLPGAEGLVRLCRRPAGGTVRLSLEGGLSVPGQNVWLEGFPPSVCVRAAAATAKLRVLSLSQNGNPVVQAGELSTHTPQPLQLATAGDYLIEVEAGQEKAPTRFVRVARWDQLEAGPLLRPFHTSIGDFLLRGACLERRQ